MRAWAVETCGKPYEDYFVPEGVAAYLNLYDKIQEYMHSKYWLLEQVVQYKHNIPVSPKLDNDGMIGADMDLTVCNLAPQYPKKYMNKLANY